MEGIKTAVVMLVAGSLLYQCGRRVSQWTEQDEEPRQQPGLEQLIKAGLCRQVEKQVNPALHPSTNTCRPPTAEHTAPSPASALRLPLSQYRFSRAANIRSNTLQGQVLLGYLAPRFLHLISNIYFLFYLVFSPFLI